MRNFQHIVLCIILGSYAVSGLQAATIDATMNGDRRAAETALATGDPSLSIRLAQTILKMNANDYQALLIVSLASTQLGQHQAAATAARKAFHATSDGGQKFQAARITGAAYFNASQFTRAEWWLRRAANYAQSEIDLTLAKQEFNQIRQRNPLSVNLSFSVTPSNNINGGSEDEFFSLDEYVFQFRPDARALSGIEYSGDVDLTYRISQSPIQITSVGTYLFGRTYSLSSASQATVPDVSGSDYSLTLAEASVKHRRFLIEGFGPTGVSAHVGQIWYGGDPLWRYQRLALSQDFVVDQKSSATISTFVEKQDALDGIQPDTKVYDLQGVYAHRLQNQDVMKVSLGYRYNDADQETYTFKDYRTSLTYNFEQPILNSRFSVSISGGHKRFDQFSLALDGRRDKYVSVGATAILEKISYWGFSPSISVSATKTNSSVSRFSNTQFQSKFGIRSNF